MDIKAKIEELTEKIKSDSDLRELFGKNPIAAIETLTGIDLPKDQVEKIIDGIKAKISLDEAGEKLGAIGDKLGNLFGKKD